MITSAGRRPFVIGIVATATDAGKTWVASALLRQLRDTGLAVSARKPVQSFAVDDETTDAAVLAAATGEAIDDVCPAHRCYPLPMAPPIAAQRLEREPIRLDDLVSEIVWSPGTDIGVVETVGGVRSPLADDGDSVALIDALTVDHVILVADAGLGAINAVRVAVAALGARSLTVILNRFDPRDAVHESNRAWLIARDGLPVVTAVDACAATVRALVSISQTEPGGKLAR